MSHIRKSEQFWQLSTAHRRNLVPASPCGEVDDTHCGPVYTYV
jgi:hypothetical protein